MKKIIVIIFFMIKSILLFAETYIDLTNDKINDYISCFASYYNEDSSKYHININIMINNIYKRYYFDIKLSKDQFPKLSDYYVADLNNDGLYEIICSLHYWDDKFLANKSSIHIFTYDYKKNEIIRNYDKYFNAQFFLMVNNDFNKDGFSDILGALTDNNESFDLVLYNMKNSNIEEKKYNLGLNLKHFHKLKIEDLNKDGFNDLLIRPEDPDCNFRNYYIMNKKNLEWEVMDLNEYYYEKYEDNLKISYDGTTKRFSIKNTKDDKRIRSSIRASINNKYNLSNQPDLSTFKKENKFSYTVVENGIRYLIVEDGNIEYKYKLIVIKDKVGKYKVVKERVK